MKETRELGQRLSQVVAQSGSVQETIASGLVKPGIAILIREQARLKRLGPPPRSEDLATYLGLFSPIIVLSEQLLAESEAQDTQQSRNLEVMVTNLIDEQTAAAKRFGLRSCAITFTSALGGEQ